MDHLGVKSRGIAYVVTERRIVDLILPDGSTDAASLSISEATLSNDGKVGLSISLASGELCAVADDYFTALQALRRDLESCGILIKCYGSSRNVNPSPMIQSMGDGDLAYRLTLGRPTMMSDRVSIFDSGPDVEAVSVDDQDRFYDQWFASPKTTLNDQ